MHSSRAAFSSLHTQQGYPVTMINVHSFVDVLKYRIASLAWRAGELRVGLVLGKAGKDTFTAAEAEPAGLRSEAMLVAVVGAARLVSIDDGARDGRGMTYWLGGW